MTFWAFIGILVILGVMFGALYVSKIASNRQEEENEKRRKIRTMRNDLVDTDELINTLIVYDRDPELLTIIADKMEQIIQEGLSLLPNNEELQGDLNALNKTRERIEQLRATPEEPENPGTDRQITLIKKNFSRTIKLLKVIQASGHISELETGQHRTRLIQNSLLLEVRAYQSQGKEAHARGEISTAANFLKHAKELLVNSEIKFKEKTDKIKEVSREISGLYVTHPDDDTELSGDEKKGDL